MGIAHDPNRSKLKCACIQIGESEKMRKSKRHPVARGFIHIDDEILAAFVENNLNERERRDVQMHLQQCPRCFENMAVLRKSLNQREALTFLPTPPDFVRQAKKLITSTTPSESIWRKASRIANTIYLPRGKWKYFIPSGIAVAILLVLFIASQGPVIQNLSTGKYLTISKSYPLGFVGESEKIAYKNMWVKLSKDKENIIFSWPKVEGAKFYQIDLLVKGDRHRITPLLGNYENSYSFPLREIELNVKYMWQISGKLEDGRKFQARASFVRKK